MELGQFLGAPLLDSPCLSCVEQGRENYCSTDSIGLVGRLLPHLYHTERRSIDLKCGFGYPCISLVINVDIAGGSARQVHELFYCGGSLVVPCDSGLLVGFAGCRLVQHLSFSVFGAGV